MKDYITVIGGGLAGCEAAYQIAKKGIKVKLYEMKPEVYSPAHTNDCLAEIVCSNSFKSDLLTNACGLLKEELRKLDSLLIRIADETKVPAGQALAVDREKFSKRITEEIENNALIEVVRKEVTSKFKSKKSDNATLMQDGNKAKANIDSQKSDNAILMQDNNKTKTNSDNQESANNNEAIYLEDLIQDSIVIIATGPLTSDSLSEGIKKLTGENELHFFDAAAPIVYKDSINFDIAFYGDRYDEEKKKDESIEEWRNRIKSKNEGSYINLPMSKEEYEIFYNELINAELIERHEFEKGDIFEGCMPVEVMAKRGIDTLRFGPLKPVGFDDPRTGKRPYALIQLRQDNSEATMYNMVGFQTNLKWGEQKRVFSLVPGLENADFIKYGVMHRNTFINSCKLLDNTYNFKKNNNIYFAGQITGVEGYVESISSGLVAGINASIRFSNNYIKQNKQYKNKIDDNENDFDNKDNHKKNKNINNNFNSKGININKDLEKVEFSEKTVIGALAKYISTPNEKFQPMNANFGILPELDNKINDKKKRYTMLAERALEELKIDA